AGFAGGYVTNNGTIWFSTNGTPTLSLPNGSICTVSDGSLFLRTNSTWTRITSGLDSAPGNTPLTNGANRVKTLSASGATLTDQGTNLLISVPAPSPSYDGIGFNLQTNVFGGNVGGNTNFLMLVSTNLSQTATNLTGTNVLAMDTAQPITSEASPSFASE